MPTLDNAVVYLLGPYGVGKLTIAKELCAETEAILVDNHLINNPILSVIGADGVTALPAQTWDFVGRVREASLQAIEELGAAGRAYVLTNVLDDAPQDRAVFARVELLARRRAALFVPVVLSCDEAENARRVASPERAANHKHTDEASAMERRRTVRPLPVLHANVLKLDTTALSPADSAGAIIRHVAGLR